ncbi:uncharacterized protein PGTG_12402 [Puccinia graminis f. sp. tritici CRL 75-36-700-3]|uniref:Uncharacterized protein n=1 Tax=Puccinia graminis f. sp. tritici (strain CRL 75-36-700-3 / race SCCL) TaxID=418459 RepID=E3KQ71_PUCGT|nr:uncharacterized protein PGTG_12402 [Puccinia graminis f. sp. tritici CRL 75-36-700-3]EFP86446.2 hypothetical protein PGTG_12402 [Puccinia graminis f. sp. tritici CRL 75-36-700-3]
MAEKTDVHPLKGIDYSEKDIGVLVRQLCKNLNQQHSQCLTEVVDFDLQAVFLMQEIGPHHRIRSIVKMVLKQFDINTQPPKTPKKRSPSSAPPQNMLQQQLLDAAKQVQKTIDTFDNNTSSRKPFCLQFPSYKHVLQNAISMQDKCQKLPTNRMVVLLDEAGICVGVVVPPFPKTPGKHHPEADDCACQALNKTVLTSSWNTNEDEVQYSSTPLDPHPRSPFPLGKSNKGESRTPKGGGDTKTSMSFQTYGFGLGDTKSKGMNDLKIPILKNQINTAKLQGYSNSWKNVPFTPSLQITTQSQIYKTQARVHLQNEIKFYSKLSLWINKSFLPASTKITEQGVQYLMSSDSDLLRKNLAKENNQIIAC